MNIFIALVIIVFFLILKGFFSGSEIAMVNSDKLKLRHQAKMGDRGAAMVVKLFQKPDIILGTTLVGTNIATVTISTLAALMFIELNIPAGDLVSVIVFTPFLLILGEIVPKSVYQQTANTISPWIIRPLRFFSLLFSPIIFIFSRIARLATRLVGGDLEKNAFISREEIRMLLEISEQSSDMARFDPQMVRRIIRFAETTTGQAMIPLAGVVGVEEGGSLKDAANVVWRNGFNRLPVYRGNLTNVIGVLTLSTWDLLEPNIFKKSMADYIQEPLYISLKQTIDEVLPLMQGRTDHIAVVVDEFGSAVGILTMEDIFEEVVGEIDVGYDFDEYHPKRKIEFQKVDEDVYLLDGRTPLTQINDVLHLRLSVEEAHTIAGLLITKLKRIPKEGEFIDAEDYRFTVKSANERAVTSVIMKRL